MSAINPTTGRPVKLGGRVYKSLLKSFDDVDGVLVPKADISRVALEISIEELTRENANLREELSMMAESHRSIQIIQNFNTIKDKLSKHLDFNYMARTRNWTALNVFLANLANRKLLISIFGYESDDFVSEYRLLRLARNNLSHETSSNNN